MSTLFADIRCQSTQKKQEWILKNKIFLTSIQIWRSEKSIAPGIFF